MLQEYKKMPLKKEEIVPLAEAMREKGAILTMIHGHMTDDGKTNIAYDYQIGNVIESYTIEGESVLPTISHIYSKAAEWAERELDELIDITFEGLDTSKRLFMPESMLDGQGQIFVTPMDDLIDKTQGKKKEEK